MDKHPNYQATHASFGYNKLTGGNRPTFTEDAKKRMSESHKIRYSHQPHHSKGRAQTELQKERKSLAWSTIHPSFRDPDGNVHKITNLRRFAKEYNLIPKRLRSVASGKFKQHKGWTLA